MRNNQRLQACWSNDALSLAAHVVAGILWALVADELNGLLSGWTVAINGATPAPSGYGGQSVYFDWDTRTLAAANVLSALTVLLWTAVLRPRRMLLHLVGGLAMTIALCLTTLIELRRAGVFGLLYRFEDVLSQMLPFALAGVPMVAVSRLLVLRRLGTLATQPQRDGPDVCTKCSYDLTGNVSGRCPECGAAQVRSAGVQNVDRSPDRPASGG